MMRLAASTVLRTLVATLSAWHGTAWAQPMVDPTQDVSDHPGIVMVDTRDLLRGAGQNDIVAATTRALTLPAAKSAHSYDIWDSEQFDATLAAFFRNAPPETAVGSAVSDAAAKERAALQAELAGCETAGNMQACRRAIAGTDYENILADVAVTPVSVERTHLQATIRTDEKRRLETALTALMERIRLQMAATLQPVRIVIGKRGDLNITARFGADTLVLGEDVIRDIFVRAFFRAANTLRQRNATMGALDDCASCGEISEDAGLFSLNLSRYLHLLAQLPGLRIRHISPKWFARAVRAGCGPLGPERDAALTRVADMVDEDLRSQIPPDELRRLGRCARDGTVRLPATGLDTYIREAELADEHEPDDLASYMPVLAEGAGMNAALSAELAKSLIFLMAHESQHLWISPNAGPDAEFAADAHATVLYLALFQEIDPDQWFRSANLPGVGFGGARDKDEAAESAALFRSILGREPGVLLREIYRGTAYYEGGSLHPPIEQRVARIEREIKAGRLAYTCEKINEIIRQAQATHMPVPADASTCLP